VLLRAQVIYKTAADSANGLIPKEGSLTTWGNKENLHNELGASE